MQICLRYIYTRIHSESPVPLQHAVSGILLCHFTPAYLVYFRSGRVIQARGFAPTLLKPPFSAVARPVGKYRVF